MLGKAFHPHRHSIALAAALIAACVLVPSAHAARARAGRPALELAQDGAGGGGGEVSPAQIGQYVAVYQAMRHNRSLTVAQAAQGQGLTLDQFRALELKIERDDAAREQARDELQSAAAGKK